MTPTQFYHATEQARVVAAARPIPEEWVETPWCYSNDAEGVSWVSCDFCFESYLEDVWAHKEIRKFYKSQKDGCIACENCVHDAPKPEESEATQ